MIEYIEDGLAKGYTKFNLHGAVCPSKSVLWRRARKLRPSQTGRQVPNDVLEKSYKNAQPEKFAETVEKLQEAIQTAVDEERLDSSVAIKFEANLHDSLEGNKYPVKESYSFKTTFRSSAL